MPFVAGDRIGRYVIDSLIGTGGMGEVYRAHDPQLNRDVAIKMLTGETADDAGLRQRFEVEARAASTINHPNIVSVYDFGEQYGLLYIVWELVKGKTLRGIKFTPRQTAEYGAQIADGLAAAHAAGIIHRDLKPENIILTEDGRAKILDFGLAKRTDSALGGGAERTQPGLMMGTVGYMSPEQIKSKDVDARSDIFSLGLVLYEMIAGQKAFKGDSAFAVLNGLLTMEPPELGPEVPMAMRQIIAHCIEKNPEWRFQTARDLEFALRSLTTSTVGTSGVHIKLQEPQVSLWKRRGFQMAIGSVLAVGMGAFFGGMALENTRHTTNPFFPLTGQHGFVSSARFADGWRTAVYTAGWRGGPSDIFTVAAEQGRGGEPKAAGLTKADLLAVSSKGEWAVLVNPRDEREATVGTLARVKPGGTPETVLEQVTAAVWDPKGEQLAVVRVAGGVRRLEYPAGKVLVESTGWIRWPRFNEAGTEIAFVESPESGDDQIAMVELSGKRTVFGNRHVVRGLAWDWNRNRIWFASTAGKGPATNIEAIERKGGSSRIMYASAGALTLEDVVEGTEVLVTSFQETVDMMAYKGADLRGVSLAVLDASSPRSLSGDGSMLAFTDGAGAEVSVYVRKTDGSAPAARLGQGEALSITDDGKRVLALLHSTPPQYVIYSLDGTALKMAAGAAHARSALLHPDGKRFVFQGGDQMWIRDLDKDQARAIGPAGVTMTGPAISPDGQFAAAVGGDGKITLYPVEGGAARSIAGAQVSDRFLQWSRDSKSIFVYNPYRLPARVERVDAMSGKRELLREIGVADASGVRAFELVMSPDLSTVVLGLKRRLSVLEVMHGLR